MNRTILFVSVFLVILISAVIARPAEQLVVKEQVKCVFVNSESVQKCYTDNGNFGCSGIGTCVAEVSGEKNAVLLWHSSCDGQAKTVMDENNEYAEFQCASSEPNGEQSKEQKTMTEDVKCIFINSNTEQKCYTESFECSGTGTCVATVSGESGQKLTWKSSCGGEALTVLDGNADYAEFKCTSDKSKTGEPSVSKEQITCVFKNSKTQQQCYAEQFSCKGQDSCIVDIEGTTGEKVTWKSSCGGYGYSVFDSTNEQVVFNCIPEEKVTEEAISGKGFSSAAWQCYDGVGKQGDKSCQSSEFWQTAAKSFCEGHCAGGKCGVNSYSVVGECYPDFAAGTVFVPQAALPATLPTAITPTSSTSTVEATPGMPTTPATTPVTSTPSPIEAAVKMPEKKTESEKEEILICKDSCARDEKCYPFGYRKAGQFCSDQGVFTAQTAEETTCDNNFECASNVCVNSKCISVGLLEKILNWFKRLWG